MRTDALTVPSSDRQASDPRTGWRPPTDTLVAGPENLDTAQLVRRIRERGHLVLRVVGGSMGPWFLPGDLLVVQRVRPQMVRRGNVIVFRRANLLIAHRVIRLLGIASSGGLTWRTKGDSAARCDPDTFESELVGRVTFVERAGRSIWLQSPNWVAAGWMLALLSLLSRFWYPIGRSLRRLCYPVALSFRR